jgi:branched-chain amino acid transport system substrate-binding protein
MADHDLTVGGDTPDSASESPTMDRRSLLKLIGAGALGAGAAGLMSGSASASPSRDRLLRSNRLAAAGSTTIHIGYVTPRTGALAGFSESDPFVIGKIRGTSQFKKGITVGGKHYSVRITLADSQSTPNRASQVAQQLALSTKVDLILTSSAPETTNPVAAAAQQYQVPCLATVVPWESWYAGLGGDPLAPTKAFQYCTMFFFGMVQFAGTFLPMWNRIQKHTGADKVFAGMYPNDTDGNAFRAGFPPFAEKEGYKLVTGGAYTDGTSTYSSMIGKFKSGNCAFFSNAPLPPTFNTFWKQAITQGYRPKLATVAKVLLFPSTVAALGKLATNIATDAWWTPFAPHKSSLTGETGKELATQWQDKTGNIWWQSLGSTYSLFEIAVEAFTAASTPHDHADVASALHSVNYTGICGHMDFAKGPAPGVGIIYPVGVQWKPGTKVLGKKFPWEPFVVDNSLNKETKLTGDLVAGTY